MKALIAVLFTVTCLSRASLAVDRNDGDKAEEKRRTLYQSAVQTIGGPDGAAKFVLALASDPNGCLWIGTEGSGLWRFDPAAERKARWSNFRDAGDDNVYAIACDKFGRIWCGSQYRGVSVFNGKEWRNYDRVSGALGERVYAIVCNPLNGDVWIATNCGLTRYLPATDSWKQYTRMDGLPSMQIGSLCFDATGNLYAGTLCDGVAIAHTSDDYATWRTVRGPSTEPLAAQGQGLPGNLINCVLAARDGTVYAGTPSGLAASTDQGRTWVFVRGADYARRVRALIEGPPADFIPGQAVMAEDWVTCLAEDRAGMIWIGHRQSGYEVLDPSAGRIDGPGKHIVYAERGAKVLGLPVDFVRAILPLNGCPPVIGGYPGIVLSQKCYAALEEPAPGPVAPAALPSPLSAPGLTELNALLRSVQAVELLDDTEAAPALTLEEDWGTRGTWVGRHGRYFACICAIQDRPFDYAWGTGDQANEVKCFPQVGKPGTRHYSNYYYVHQLYNNNVKTLELPPPYLAARIKSGATTWENDRREAEWNDGGFQLPMEMDGPNLEVKLTVPPGVFFLSVYNHNKDGHVGKNRCRDYPVYVHADPPERKGAADLAHGRLIDFVGGAYQRFLLRGPGKYTIEIQRNHSHTAEANGVFLDSVFDEVPYPYAYSQAEWEKHLEDRAERRKTSRVTRGADFVPAKDEAEAARRLFAELDLLRLRNVNLWARERRRFYAPLVRYYTQALLNAEPNGTSREWLSCLASCFHHVGLFKPWEDCRKLCGLAVPREIETSLKETGEDSNGSERGREWVLAQVIATGGKPDPDRLAAGFGEIDAENPRARIRAIDRIAMSSDPRTTPALLTRLKDADALVRASAADALRIRRLFVPATDRQVIGAGMAEYERNLLANPALLSAPVPPAQPPEEF